MSFFLKGGVSTLFLNIVYYAWQILSLAKSIRVLANMEDPIGRILKKTQVREGV